MDRREFLRLSGGAAIIGVGFTALRGGTVWAQGSTPLADLGLPEVRITIDDAGFQVLPSETPAGWTLVTFTNTRSPDNVHTADLVLLPEGQTVEDVMNVAATPTAGPPPTWMYETTWAGGPIAVGGTSAQAVVNLPAGDVVIWSAGEAFAATELAVTAASEATPAPPSLTPDVEVTLEDHAFTGLAQTVPAGPHVWKVTTTGTQPHFMIFFSVPQGATTEQLLGAFGVTVTGTPDPNPLDFATVRPAGGSGILSLGQTAWHSLDLAAGTYGAVCFVPDEATGAPHVMLGMATVFTVA